MKTITPDMSIMTDCNLEQMLYHKTEPRRCLLCGVDISSLHGNRRFCCDAHAHTYKLQHMSETYQLQRREQAEYRRQQKVQVLERQRQQRQQQPKKQVYMGVMFEIDSVKCLAIGQVVGSWEREG